MEPHVRTWAFEKEEKTKEGGRLGGRNIYAQTGIQLADGKLEDKDLTIQGIKLHD